MWGAQAILDSRLSFSSCKDRAILVGSVRELILLNVVLLHLGSYSYTNARLNSHGRECEYLHFSQSTAGTDASRAVGVRLLLLFSSLNSIHPTHS